MMTRLSQFGIMVAMLGLALSTHAATFGDYTYTVSGTTATITDFKSTALDQELIIPDQLGGYPVTRIGDNAFEDCANLTSVTLLDSVTNIGYNAFESCTSLAEITIPVGVTSIGYGAFEFCTSLTNITVAESNPVYSSREGVLFGQDTLIKYPPGRAGEYTIPSDVTIIGAVAFRSCASLTSITIPDGVTIIEDDAFAFCAGLSSVTIPGSVTHIGNTAFGYCSALTNIVIPASVSSIGGWTFVLCTRLASITIPASVTSIGSSAFEHCSSLSHVTIPHTVATIGDYAFLLCTSMTSVTLPDSITSIAEGTFKGCTNLLYATIPHHVTSIGARVFESCSSLTQVSVPDTVASLGEKAFYYCTNVSNLYFAGNAPTVGASVFSGDERATCYYLAGATGWSSSLGGRPAVRLKTFTPTLTVAPSYGATSPGTLTTGVFAMVSELLVNSPVLNGTTQYVCTGGIVTGNDYTLVSPTHVTLTLTNDATLTWQWQTNYYLIASVAGGGSVSGSTNGWYPAGSQAVLTATAASHTHFVTWQGDTNGCTRVGATLIAPMAQARAISALFATITNQTLTVVSAHGGTTSGTLVTYYGTALQEWIMNSPVVNGTTQYVCTGGSVVGNDYTLVPPTNVTLTLTNDATLTWQWQTNYYLAASSSGAGGSLLGSSSTNGWYPAGFPVTLTGVAQEGYHFAGWSGSTNGGLLASNVWSGPLDQARTLAASFALDQETLQVVSAHGSATPAEGVYPYSYGTVLTNTVTSLPASGGTQYVAAGWVLDGNVPLSGAGTNVTVTLTNNAVLTWLWQTNYYLAASSSGAGGNPHVAARRRPPAHARAPGRKRELRRQVALRPSVHGRTRSGAVPGGERSPAVPDRALRGGVRPAQSDLQEVERREPPAESFLLAVDGGPGGNQARRRY